LANHPIDEFLHSAGLVIRSRLHGTWPSR
jgi:hypothetical protein